jgi:hypothetical protein
MKCVKILKHDGPFMTSMGPNPIVLSFASSIFVVYISIGSRLLKILPLKKNSCLVPHNLFNC